MKLSDVEAAKVGKTLMDCYAQTPFPRAHQAVGHAAYQACREIVLAQAVEAIKQLPYATFRPNTFADGYEHAVERLKSLTQPRSKREKVEARLKEYKSSHPPFIPDADTDARILAAEIDAIYKESE
jgi:hypothetical protein